MQTKESQFSAGTACEPCQVMGHFCPAHDFNLTDDPACVPCLSGLPCAQKQVRNGEFYKAEEPAAVAREPVKRNLFPNAVQKVATATPKQAPDLATLCDHGCGKPRHPGVCAARKAAIATKKTPPIYVPEPVPEEEEPPVSVPDTTQEPVYTVWFPQPTEGPIASKPVATQEMRDAVKTFDKPADQPELTRPVEAVRTVRVVPLASLPPQLNWKSKYDGDVATFSGLTASDCMEFVCADRADAERCAKVFSRELERRKLRARYRISGDSCFFWKREDPNTSHSEVPSR